MRVPTNLISGFLGVGKSTAILHLLRNRPSGGHWAVVVNEFGKVGIDQAMLEDESGGGVVVKEVPGGCICCTAGVMTQVAIVDVLRRIKPERLLVEPTGLAHPGGILDLLTCELFRDHLDLRATVCLVDPRHFLGPRMTEFPAYSDQIHMADVLVANKCDLADAEQVDAYLARAVTLFPPKVHVATTTHGRIDPGWLDLDLNPARVALFPEAHGHEHHQHHDDGPGSDASIQPGKPIRREGHGLGCWTCGWIFSPEDVFERGPLLSLLEKLGTPGSAVLTTPIERLKGVFRVGSQRLLVNRVDGAFDCHPIPYRRDSRVEIIARESVGDWDALDLALRGCLKTSNS